MKAGVQIDRTSCCQFVAHRLRVLVAIMAMSLPQLLSWQVWLTVLARAQVERLQVCLLKLGAQPVRRVRMHLAQAAP